MPLTTKRVQASTFAAWRLAFGLYLAYASVRLIPYARELYSEAGIFPYPGAIWGPAADEPVAPLLRFVAIPAVSVFLVSLKAPLALAFALGFRRRAAALLYFLCAILLVNRNMWTNSPEHGFVLWLLLASALVPEGEPAIFPKRKAAAGWAMPASVYWGAWVVMATGYAYAAGTKVFGHQAEYWLDGSAIAYILVETNALHNWVGNAFSGIPPSVSSLLTWGTLVLEGGGFVFLWRSGSRAVWWACLAAMHLSLLVIMNLPELTLGMLFFHWFVYDSTWLARVKKVDAPATV